MTTGADIIAGKLHAAGCRHAFGIPGGEVLALMQALDEAGLNFVLVKHENAGGFMAEGGWHADGAPGVLLATLGPGAANAVNVVANAWQDRVPLIFLTGCVDHGEAESYTHQVFDHQQLLRPSSRQASLLAWGAGRDDGKGAGHCARRPAWPGAHRRTDPCCRGGNTGSLEPCVPVFTGRNRTGVRPGSRHCAGPFQKG